MLFAAKKVGNVKELFANLDANYRHTLKAMPRGQTEFHPITFSCNVPHKVVSIDDNLNCLVCLCDGWLPLPVGQVHDFESLVDVFSSPKAKILQDDVDAKNYTWCAVQHCGIKYGNIEQSHYELAINIDRSCNLQCPSCRRDKFMLTSGPMYDKKIAASNRILSWLEKFDDKINIVLSGDGDPLASLVVRPIIKNWKYNPNQTLILKTNGLLLRKQLQNTEILKNAFLSISIDAGSKEVFESIRRGGNWEVLLDNFDFLVKNDKQQVTTLNFTIQNDNYLDLENFVELCEKYQFQGSVAKLDDWGTWNDKTVSNPDEWTQENGYFFEHDVLHLEHENYEAARQICTKFLNHPLVGMNPSVLERL
jgi:molybdenum cofactor biosynthesis enzyme MoaA